MGKHQFYKLIIGLTLIFFCNSLIKPNNQINENTPNSLNVNGGCLIVHDSLTFMNEYFPFVFENYNTIKFKKFFSKSVTIDSMETNNEGFITRVYSFKNKMSEISFFVKINDPDPYFFLYGGTIKDNFFKSKNGVKISMKREDFFKAINEKPVNCDTLTIKEGEMATFYYFIFKNNKLNSIEIQQTQ